MPTFRTAEVTELISARRGLQRVRVRMPDGTDARAYVLTQLVGECAVGDAVVVNTTAVELGLGTGGWHFVHWNLARDEFVSPGPEHIMKLRYTSLQFDAGTDELTHPECDDPLGGGAGDRVLGPQPGGHRRRRLRRRGTRTTAGRT